MQISFINILPSLDVFQKNLVYSQETGQLLWKERDGCSRHDRIWNTKWAGKNAGTLLPSGYISVRMSGYKSYLAKHIIWKMMTGDDPPRHLSPIDGDRLNHKFENLRKKELDKRAPRRSSTESEVITKRIEDSICLPTPQPARNFMSKLEVFPDKKYEVVLEKDGVSMRLDLRDIAELLDCIPAQKWASTVINPEVIISKSEQPPLPNDLKTALGYAWELADIEDQKSRGAWRVTLNKFQIR